ncbi:hypothetical protein ACI78R_06785 [Geodermatophilus sp. SYSU D01106]
MGAETVARYLLGVVASQRRRAGDDPETSVGTVNGRSGIVVRAGDTVVGTIDLSIAGGLVTRVFIQVNPDKLPT